MASLTISNLNFAYGTKQILNNFNLTIPDGSIYCLVGPSGCGKSTLLKAICGIVNGEGDVMLNDTQINPIIHAIAYIPQNYGLSQWLTIEQNLLLVNRIKRNKISDVKDEIVSKLGISELLQRYPNQLSGGQQQRVALARALLLNPDVMLMDEPFSSLDTFTAATAMELFTQIYNAKKTTTLFVTHNISEAVRIGNYIVLLSDQPTNVMEIIQNTGENIEQHITSRMKTLWRGDE
ncbi:MAG: ATP-binding cassette domain-containing protein [Ignavibacteria bacterium]|jgi:NitT/TauT family transport system ATP-binding protein|nr:ATP-binding cassette domain-containing protein [Ignavibacteria bacterium]